MYSLGFKLYRANVVVPNIFLNLTYKRKGMGKIKVYVQAQNIYLAERHF